MMNLEFYNLNLNENPKFLIIIEFNMVELINTRNQIVNECSVNIPEDSKRALLRLIDAMEDFFSQRVKTENDRFSKFNYKTPSFLINEDKKSIPHQSAVVIATNISFYENVEEFSTLKDLFDYVPDYKYDEVITPDLELNIGWTYKCSDVGWPMSITELSKSDNHWNQSNDSSSSGKN